MGYRMIQVGTGGWGASWCRNFLPPNVEQGLIEVVAAVDVNPEAHINAIEGLGLAPSQCYTDLDRALDENAADFVTIVVPPARHEAVVDRALAHDLHILSEKPLADTLSASVRIAGKVRRANKLMGVTMSHRFDADKTSLREQIRSGSWGALDYLVGRFTCNNRKFGSWGKFRHEIPDTLMIEGAVHHLDLLADMAGGLCQTLYAQTWTPAWGEFAGDAQGLVMMRSDSGVRTTYEGAKCNAWGLNCWGEEYVRAECEGGTLILDHRGLAVYPYDAALPGGDRGERQPEPLPLLYQPKWANTWLIEKFVRWLDGGEPMETNVQDNLQSVALVFAAIESSRTGMPVKVQEFLAAVR